MKDNIKIKQRNEKLRILWAKVAKMVEKTFFYVLLFVAFMAIIFSFWLFFKGFHDVDLFVNRVVMFNDLYVEAGVGIDARNVNETAVNIRTGEKIIIPNIDLYTNGFRQIFIGFVLLFFAAFLYPHALSGLIGSNKMKNFQSRYSNSKELLPNLKENGRFR